MSRFIRDRSTVCLSFITNVFIWEGGCLGDKAKGCAGRVQFCAEARLSALEGGGGGHYRCNRFFMGPFLVVKIALS